MILLQMATKYIWPWRLQLWSLLCWAELNSFVMETLEYERRQDYKLSKWCTSDLSSVWPMHACSMWQKVLYRPDYNSSMNFLLPFSETLRTVDVLCNAWRGTVPWRAISNLSYQTWQLPMVQEFVLDICIFVEVGGRWPFGDSLRAILVNVIKMRMMTKSQHWHCCNAMMNQCVYNSVCR